MQNEVPEAVNTYLARRAGSSRVRVILNADALALWNGQAAPRVAAFAVRVRTIHRAGDAFVGALAAEWMRGTALEVAARFGQAAAALVVSSTVEARAKITEGDVRAFLRASGPAKV